MIITIRPLTPADEPFLWEMLYQAIYVPEGHTPPSRDIIHLPELAHYVQGWGRVGDGGFLALDTATGQPVAAAWLRYLAGEDKGYGYVADDIPELSLAVLPDDRGQGIGTQLLTQLFASPIGQRPVSLSVSVGNPARWLYQRFGFEVVSGSAESLTMKREPSPPSPVGRGAGGESSLPLP